MDRSLTVVVTGVGSTTAQSVLKGLRKQQTYDVEIIGVDINPSTNIAGAYFCDHFERVAPATHTKQYLSDLRTIVDRYGVDLVIPIVDIELGVIAEHRNVFDEEVKILLPSEETIRICNDKYDTYEWFSATGIPTPTTLSNPTLAEVLDHFNSFPLVAKPTKGVSSRDVYEIRNEDELCLLERIDTPVVQPKLAGDEYTLDAFRRDGQTVVVPRQRVDTRSGISYKGRTVDEPRLIEYGKRIMDELNLFGPANIQCFVDSDGGINFFEINPRFSGSLSLTIEAGVNSPRFALDWAADESSSIEQDFEEVTMHRYWNEVFYADERGSAPLHLQ
ncbi:MULTISPECIES: ATP-grasp domain-containing protein [Halorussus]|uniref:ATP-grasp domain-containing protein n=1 Tax=Halorussus TaxID=1070314 RepID=UPI000E21481B|nr:MULTISPECIES: ATP-grasp domain-containing protein [Halorussus]NHN60114.1 ATP-grasp domain-containing protein [Halorussus sp. JP-T4]